MERFVVLVLGCNTHRRLLIFFVGLFWNTSCCCPQKVFDVTQSVVRASYPLPGLNNIHLRHLSFIQQSKKKLRQQYRTPQPKLPYCIYRTRVLVYKLDQVLLI